MTFQKGQPRIELILTQADDERIWELFFGKRYSLNRIGNEYGLHYSNIARSIDRESARRWREHHPHETNREHLQSSIP